MTTPRPIPLFGRDAELARLGALFARAVAGQPVVAVVGGEAGVGKTRLVAELAAQAEGAGALVLAGAAVDVGECPPLLPLGLALRKAVRDPARAALLEPWRAELEGLGLLPVPPGTSRPAAPAHPLDAVSRVFTGLAEVTPLVVVLDDLQWADRATQDLLTYLTASLHDEHLLLVATHRTSGRGGDGPVPGQLRRHPRVHGFVLEPLDRVATTRITRAHGLSASGTAGASDPGADPADLVWERSRGNAFIAEETVRALRDNDPLALPATLRELVQDRVRALPEDARQVVRALAVGEGPVGHTLLAQVTGLPPERLLAAVRAAVDDGSVLVDASVPEPVHPRGGEGYRLRHGLMVAAVSADLLPAERRELHRRFAEALQAAAGRGEAGDPPVPLIDAVVAAERPRPSSPPVRDVRNAAAPAEPQAAAAGATSALEAYHWDQAGEPARALHAAAAAAEAAEQVHGYADAHQHWRRAVELQRLAPDAAERPGVLRRAAEAAHLAGEHDAAVSALQELIALRGEDPLLVADLGRYLLAAGRTSDAERALRRGTTLLEPRGGAALRQPRGGAALRQPGGGAALPQQIGEAALPQYSGGAVEQHSGRVADQDHSRVADRRHSGVAADLRRGTHSGVAADLQYSGVAADRVRSALLVGHTEALWLSGRFVEARAEATRALEAARATGNAEEQARVLAVLGFSQAYLEDTDAGAAALAECQLVAERSGSPDVIGRAYHRRAELLSGPLNELAAGIQVALDGAARLSALGLGRTYGVQLLALAANGQFRTGQWDEAVEVVDRAWATRPVGSEAMDIRLARTRLTIGRGQLDRAAADLDAVELMARATAGARYRIPMLTLRAGLDMFRGVPDHAVDHVLTGLDVLEEGAADDVWLLAPLVWHGLRAYAETVRLDRPRPTEAQIARMQEHMVAMQERARGAVRLVRDIVTAFVLTCDAESSRAAGESDPELWAEVVRQWERHLQPYPAAYARLRCAEALLARRTRNRPAADALAQAYEVVTRLRAEPLRGEIADLARRARIPLPDPGPPATEGAERADAVARVPVGQARSGRDSAAVRPAGDEAARLATLTPREQQVLAEIAAGCTNREIARRLFISEKTVGIHVTHILAKLAVRTRVGAGGVYLRHQGAAEEPAAT